MPPTRRLRAACAAFLLCLSFAAPAAAVTATGRLQVIHLDVGQGDGALIISPLGQVAMIDNGDKNLSPAMGQSVVQQLQARGVTHIDHHFASHYHQDHINNMTTIAAAGITFGYGWDRAGSYTTATYTNYVNTLGTKRRTLVKGQVITLDSLSAHPVTITCVDLAGAGVSTTDENSLCLMLKVTYGEYDETFGGDLPYSGINPESRIALEVGTAEVYKVHHHGSATSSSDAILAAIQAQVGVISCGNGNSYGHPTAAALSRLHARNMRTYWTETGAGVAPLAGWDKVSNGQVVISATWEPAGVDTIRGNGFEDTIINSGTPSADALPPLANLTAPDGGEVWKAGSAHTLTWTASDNVGVASVDLAWSEDGGFSWSPIATAVENTGTYAWVVPASATTSGRVRVVARDAAGNLGADSSFSTFSIDWWTIASSAGVGGTITPSGTVNVAEGANSSFSIAPGAGFQIAELLVDGAPAGALAAYEFSAVAAHHSIAASFLDVAPPAVAVTSPAGGEEWAQGSLHDITWTASDNRGVDSVSVDYSVHGPLGPWVPVAHALANSGSYAWQVPALDSDSALVRVTAYDPALLAGTGTSAGLFQLGRGTLGVGGPGTLALALALEPPSPNPSAGAARIGFSLPQAGYVRLEIYDLSGRRVWSEAGELPAGSHSRAWSGVTDEYGRVRGGLFFVRLVTPWGTRGERLVRIP